MVLPLIDPWEEMHLDHSIPDVDCIYCYPEPIPFIADPKGSFQHGQTQEIRHGIRAEDSPE
jgi:hypothetical protein